MRYQQIRPSEERAETLERLSVLNILAIIEDIENLIRKAGFDPNQPRHPAGSSVGGQWSGGSGRSNNLTGVSVDGGKVGYAPASWNNPGLIDKKFGIHGSDFKAKSAIDYANKAEKFRQKGINLKLPAIEYNTGQIGIYDKRTNTFGLYTKEGKTITFYKPTSKTYFERQIQQISSNGGRVINPLRRGGGGAGFTDPKNPFDNLDDLLKSYTLAIERKYFPTTLDCDN